MNHLVSYDFSLSLQPIFITHVDGRIEPILNYNEKSNPPVIIQAENTDNNQLTKQLIAYQEEAFEVNQQYRKVKNIQKPYYWYNQFATEGKVLFISMSTTIVC